MKTAIIFASLLMVMAFAGGAHAQTRTQSTTWSGPIALSSTATVGIAIPAGKTLRFKAPRETGAIRDGALLASFYAFDTAYLVPCDDAAGASRIGSKRVMLQVSGNYNDGTYSWKTDPKWKGTCGLLTIKLRDSGEVHARVQFK